MRKEPVQRGPDHRRAAGAGSRCGDGGGLPWHGISTTTFYKWKARYGGLEVSEARRLNALEDALDQPYWLGTAILSGAILS
jgi:hypothetical protein